jgi:hypothetical protein
VAAASRRAAAIRVAFIRAGYQEVVRPRYGCEAECRRGGVNCASPAASIARYMDTSRTTTLQTELDTFESLRMSLLDRAAGKYALVKETDLVDTFETELDAIREGYRRFGNTPFLVKHIVVADVPIMVASFSGFADRDVTY